MTRRLIMLRHGQTDYNATRRMQGHLNTKLSPVGFEQAAAAADFLTNKNSSKSFPPTSIEHLTPPP